MSEHRRHEFLVVGSTLDETAMRVLRGLYPCARITADSLVDLDGSADPEALLDRWFDVYLGADGAAGCVLALRVPFAAVDPGAAAAYCAGASLALRPTRRHLVVEFRATAAAAAPADAARLAGLRDDLAAGDPRPLYLGWLGAAQSGALPGAAMEPPRPERLDAPTPAQAALAAFLSLDPDLVAAAGRAARRPRTVAALREAGQRIASRRRRPAPAAA